MIQTYFDQLKQVVDEYPDTIIEMMIVPTLEEVLNEIFSLFIKTSRKAAKNAKL